MKHQNETENDFSAIMAEMEELKQRETKPVLIKSCHSATQSTQKTGIECCRSMPDMRQFSSCDPQDCGGYERQSRYLQPPPLQYNGGGLIRQHSRERREPPTTTPYARSRSPSPNISSLRYGHSPPPSQQPVLLVQRETSKPCSGNTLQPPSHQTYRQRSHSDSNLPDHPVQFLSALCPPSYLAPSHHRAIINSPAPQRRNPNADIFHSQLTNIPPRKTHELGNHSPQIILTSPDGHFQQNIHPLSFRLPQIKTSLNYSEVKISVFHPSSWQYTLASGCGRESRGSSENTDEEMGTENHLFEDINNFIHENVTVETDDRRSKNQIDLDCDNILKQLILN